MRIITLLNEKGGVGKTTLSTHLAAYLALQGQKVILVDSDPQAHATVTLGIAKSSGFYDLMVRDDSFQSVLRMVSPEVYEIPDQETKGTLYLVPSNVETRNIANSISDAFAIAEKFREVEDFIDVVVFDTSPTPSLLHGAIYIATDAILYPTKCEFLSFDGLVESMKHRSQAESHRKRWGLEPIHLLGIIPTMFRNKTLEHSENLAEMQKMFGDAVWEPIPQRTIWTEITRMHSMVWTAAPTSQAANDAIAMGKRFMKELQNV
jgi:chromosome partitioning protein